MTDATHPDPSDWVDHVRGLGDASRRRELDAHLAACARCHALAAQFASVAELARADAGFAASPAALRLAEAIPAQFRPDPVTTLPRLVARLLGGPIPALAGFRSGGSGVREAQWQAGPYALRVRVERERESPALAIVGHLDGSAASPAAPVADLPVLLTTGRHVVARTACNAFGEFALACEPAPQLRLQIGAVEGRVDVPLSRLLSTLS